MVAFSQGNSLWGPEKWRGHPDALRLILCLASTLFSWCRAVPSRAATGDAVPQTLVSWFCRGIDAPRDSSHASVTM
jgi:hypothetical protein